MHYAEKLNNQLAISILHGKRDLITSDDAIEFPAFFWAMTDASVEDYENNLEIVGVTDLQHWTEKLMNITIGYMKNCGFKEEWTRESNRINVRG